MYGLEVYLQTLQETIIEFGDEKSECLWTCNWSSDQHSTMRQIPFATMIWRGKWRFKHKNTSNHHDIMSL